MAEVEPIGRLVGEFSDPDASPVPWADVVRVLESSEMFWLSSVRRDGRPHVVPLPAMWQDNRLHFVTGPREQKAKNLEANTKVVLTTGTNDYRSGLDVVVEGEAIRVTDNETLTRLSRMWQQKIDWLFEVGDGVFIDTTAEPGADPGLVFAVIPAKVLAFGKSPYSQTRYVMPSSSSP